MIADLLSHTFGLKTYLKKPSWRLASKYTNKAKPNEERKYR